MKYLKIFLISLFVLVSCSDTGKNPISNDYNYYDSSSELFNFNINKVDSLLSGNADLPIKAKYDVKGYQIIYKAKNIDGEEIKLSAELIIPVADKQFPLISWQHGTELKRSNSPSLNPYANFDALEGLLLASQGFVVIIPDYIGLGVNTDLHPYLIAELSAESVLSGIDAAKEFMDNNLDSSSSELKDKIFLAGYSEGGYITMATQRLIETTHKDEYNLVAVSPMAGPYNMKHTFESSLKANQFDNVFGSLMLISYNHYYNWNLKDKLFSDYYSQNIENLLSGNYSAEELRVMLYDKGNALNSEFAEKYFKGEYSEIENDVEKNNLLNWSPVAPIRMFHGEADEIVDYQNSLDAIEYFESIGANAELVTIKDGTHFSSALPASLGMFLWFTNFME